MGRKAKLHKVLSRFHRLFALLVGLQLLLWTGGGLFMVIAPIETVRSEHHQKDRQPNPIQPTVMAERIKALDVAPLSVTAVARAGKTLLEVRSSRRGYWLIDPKDGREIPIDAAFVRAEALDATKPPASVGTVRFIDHDPPIDWRRGAPVWRVEMAQPEGLILYVDPHNGRVAAWRSDLWRWFDFFWMLHIMDYEGRDDLNNWLVRIFAFNAFVFALSGLGLLSIRIRPDVKRVRRRLARKT